MTAQNWQKRSGEVILRLLALLVLVASSFVGAGQARAAGNLTVEIIAAPNLVVDSNALATSTYAPKVATVIGKFCNTGDTAVDNVQAFIGNSAAGGTPGVYPVRSNPVVGGLSYIGDYAFTHVGPVTDATRFMGSLAPGACRYQYWSFEYPHYATVSGGTTVATWGTSVKPLDDLSLSFDMWIKGDGVTTVTGTHTATMRNEISAMANKIKPHPDGQWFNTDTSVVLPGQTITTNGILYRLGNVNQGFDNNNDGAPDYNAWLQPFGDPAFDTSCFRLVSVTGVLTVTRSAGNPDLIIPIDNNLYFTDLPSDNTNVEGKVYYEFLALRGACTIPITPYQEVASGSDNEKFNGDYGTGVPSVMSYPPEVILDKTGNTTVAEPGTITYQIPFYNNSTTADAGLTLSSGGVYAPLMVQDAVPDGLQYAAGTAAITLDYVDPDAGHYTIYYSTNSGATWSTTDPGNVTSTAPDNLVVIRWVLNDPLPKKPGSGTNTSAGNATFQARVLTGYIAGGGDPFIENCAQASFGDGEPFAEACAPTMVTGNNSIGDKVWDDANTNATDDTEPGLVGVSLYLYWDRDEDGVLDDTDPQIATTASAAGGAYLFDNLPDARFIVQVDSTTAPAGYRPTSPVSGWTAVNLIDPGDIHNTTTDFGLGPALSLTKTSLASTPSASYGTIGYKIELRNNMAGSGTSQRACVYTVWGQSVDTDQSGSGGTGAAWNNEPGATKSPDTVFAVAPLIGNSETLAISSFSLGNKGTINKVELLLPIDSVGAPAGTLDVSAIDYATGANGVAIIAGGDLASYSDGTLVTTICNTALSCQTAPFGSWAHYAGTVKSIQMIAKKSANPPGDFGVDAVGLRITTDGTCGDNSTDITFLPLTDTYDSNVLEFVSASVYPDNVTPGTLTWNNLGTLYAGGTREIYVTFRVKTTALTGTNNTATATGAKFGDGLPTNSPVSDSEPIIGIVGDRVWYDLDGAGDQDAGEPGIPGVTVRLCSNSGCGGGGNVLYATATTDASGNYLFSGLTFGTTYYVVVTSPAGFTGTGDRDGGGFSTSHAFTPSSSNVVDLSYDWGYDTGANGGVSGYVWNDIDADGVIDTGEAGYGGVTVELCTGTPPTCTSQGTTTTDSSGFYQFANRAPGTNYFVRVPTPPASTTQTYEYNALCGTCDGSTINLTVASNAVTSNINLGYRRTGTSVIGDFIFRDWNGDAVQDTGEEGISGLTVKLYLDNDNDGVVDPTDYLVGTQTTTASGGYEFTALPAGNYLVVVSPPANHVQTLDPGEAGVCAVCDSTSRQIGVDGTSEYRMHDYAYKPSGAGEIGDFVWADMDGDGNQDLGETGIAGITVWLYEDNDNNGVYDSGVDALVATTETDSDGGYLFQGLAPDNYVVLVDASDADLPEAGGRTFAPSTATTVAVTLATATSSYRDADYGFMPFSSIGDLVWRDDDGDGNPDTGEPGINGVLVELYLDANNDGVADGAAIATDTTANNSSGQPGYYLFGGLDANNYIVKIAASNLSSGGALDGYTQTGDPDAPSQPCAGADCNNSNWLKGITAPDSTFFPGLQLGQNDMSSDFGYQPPGGAIGDTVWIDTDGDGSRDADELGIAYITVALCADAGCTSVLATTETDENGYYAFAGLADGTYFVVVPGGDPDLPGGLSLTYDRDGTPDGAINTIVLSGGQVDSVGGISCSGCDMEMDFGYRFAGNNTIHGTAWHDDDSGGQTGGTGDIDAGETVRYGDVPVYLWRCVNGCGGTDDILVSQTTTLADGTYSFTNLANGDYRVAASSTAYSIRGTTPTTPMQYFPVTLAGGTTARRDYGFLSAMDMGDLPSAFSNTLLADNGARHVIPTTGAVYLGSTPDEDADGKENATAAGDTDEGITGAPSTWTNGTGGGSVDVTVGGCPGTCYLSAWVDWNEDDDLADGGERIMLDRPVTNNGGAPQTLTFNVPAGTLSTTSKTLNIRFRLYATTTNGMAQPTGLITNGEVSDYQWLYTPPTAVDLASFQAAGQPGYILLTWETVSEASLVGFNLYRADAVDGARVQLNGQLITNHLPGSPAGSAYQYVDVTATPGITYYYWVELMDAAGDHLIVGPTSAAGGAAPEILYRIFLPQINQ